GSAPPPTAPSRYRRAKRTTPAERDPEASIVLRRRITSAMCDGGSEPLTTLTCRATIPRKDVPSLAAGGLDRSRKQRRRDAEEPLQLVHRVDRPPDRLGEAALAARTARRARTPLQATREEPLRLRPRATRRASRRRRVARRPPDRPHDRRDVQRPPRSVHAKPRPP